MIAVTPTDPYSSWAAATLTPGINDGKAQDPDGDGLNNLGEFALDSNPLNGADSGKIVSQAAMIGGTSCYVMTLPVRSGAVFTGTTSLASTPLDGLVYHIEATTDFVDWQRVVTEVTGDAATPFLSGLPPVESGWSYRTFRIDRGLINGFLRVRVSEAPATP